MTRGILAGLVGAALLALPGTAAAQRYVSLSFSSLGLGLSGVRVTDIAADATNRIWITTTEGVSAVVGGARAPFFPFRANDGLSANTVRAVTFARVSGEEQFFLGFPSGIQWGRILETTGLSLADAALTDPSNDALNDVNELASVGSGSVWSATRGGLVEWDLSGGEPTENSPFLESVAPVTHVAVAPWDGDAAVIASSGPDLYLVRTGGSLNPSSFDTRNDDVTDLTFDGAGNLWALTAGRDVVRYNATPDTGPLDGTVDVFRFNAALRTVHAISVDPFDGTVWLGTDLGAYFQTPQGGNLVQDLCGAGDTTGVGCWSLDTASGSAQSEQVDVLYTDPSGNTWFGTSGGIGSGIKGRIVRLLSLNASQYLGDGASAVITLEDLPTFAGNGNDSATNTIDPDTATIQVSVGSATQDVTAVEQPGDSGSFSFTVRLADIGTVPGAEGSEVRVEYAFRDATDTERTLTALARWANIVDFEDDLWIGGGPCFLRSLAL